MSLHHQKLECGAAQDSTAFLDQSSLSSPVSGISGACCIGDDLQIETVAFTLPLAGNQRRLGDVVDRPVRPIDRANDGVQIRCGDGLDDSRRVFQVFGAFDDIGDDLEQRMLEADRLRPGSA